MADSPDFPATPEQVAGIHRAATDAAREYLKAAIDTGAAWPGIAIGAETFVAAIVVSIAQTSAHPNPQSFASEIIDLMTERAFKRAIAALQAG